MTESTILELLSNGSGPNASQSFQKLSLDSVQNISKNIAEMMYNSLTTTKNTLNENKRLNILLLLQKWCSNTGSHIKISDDNYDCLIEALTKALQGPEDTQISFEEPHLNLPEVLLQHYTKLNTIKEQNFKFIEIIRNRDRKKCGGGFMFVPNPKNLEPNENLSDLTRITELKGCNTAIPVNKTIKSIEPLSRQKQISLAYALLNLNYSHSELLSKILDNLKTYETLHSYEIKFIEDLWKKSGTPQIALQLLENFNFLYEKVFIKMCTDALQSSITQDLLIMPEEAERILQLSAKSERLHNKIRNVFYELYAYSGFNTKLSCYFSLIS